MRVDRMGEIDGPPWLGFRRMEVMARHRSHSVAFKRQVAGEFVAGETLHALAKRHDISRQLIRIWVGKFEAGAFEDAQAADLIQEYEARIAALERMVGRQALELELLKGALKGDIVVTKPIERLAELERSALVVRIGVVVRIGAYATNLISGGNGQTQFFV